MFSVLPVERSSTAVTSAPRRTHTSHSQLPMNPAPPVISTFFPAKISSFRPLSIVPRSSRMRSSSTNVSPAGMLIRQIQCIPISFRTANIQMRVIPIQLYSVNFQTPVNKFLDSICQLDFSVFSRLGCLQRLKDDWVKNVHSHNR